MLNRQADRIRELESKLSSRDAEVAGLHHIIDEEAKDSALVIIERDQLREQVKMLHKTLSGLVKAIDAAEYSTQFQMNLRIAEEALAATEPKP